MDIQYSEFRAHSVFQGKHKLFKNTECKNYIQYSENFQENFCCQSKRKFLKNRYFNAVKIFRASASCSKFWRIKNTFNTVNSEHTLFFRASKSCSNILTVKSILNTAKNFMTNSVFSASVSSSKILKNKNISVQCKISGHTLFFRASASCSKFGMIKNIYIEYSEFRAHFVFQGKPQVAQKSWKI